MGARRVALVTGGAGGIGRAVVRGLRGDGLAVAVLDLEPAADSWPARGGDDPPVLAVRVDVADADAAVAAVRTVEAELGPVDVLVNNAGVMHKKPLGDTTLADWDAEMAVNARAAFVLCREIVPAMADRGDGVVVNVASIWADRGGPDRVAYIAAKHALLGLTRALAAEFGGRGVRVNAVSPGPVRTPMTAGLGGDQSAWLAPEEVADAVRYLCGGGARGVRGANLEVFGRGRPAGL
ncbi:MAG: SDR family NAD(P)-dependent oxidoreductase [Acidimicrobiia bacterium]